KRRRAPAALLLVFFGWPLHGQFFPSEPAAAFTDVGDIEHPAIREGRRRALLPAGDIGSPFHFGKLVFRPRISYQIDYGDGVQTRPGRDVKTTLQRVSPGVAIELGPAWTFEYL